MRIWDEQLDHDLCDKHLLAEWREGLGVYSILKNGKRGYRSHPQVKMYENNIPALYERLMAIRSEMVERGFNPKMLDSITYSSKDMGEVVEWQPLKKQIQILKEKGCACRV